MFQLYFDKNKAWVTERETLTVFSQGYDAVEIDMNFSDDWSGLAKIAVFRAYDTQIDIAVTGSSVEIPVNVLLKPNVHLLFGLYGVSSDGKTVIPTVWADLGIIQPAANPTDSDNYGPPALGLYAQVSALAAEAAAAAAQAISGNYSGTLTFSISSAGVLSVSRTIDGTTVSADIGGVTAYAAAVAGGYNGTLEEFQALLIANGRTASGVAALEEAMEEMESAVETASANASNAVSTANTAAAAASAASTAASAAQTAVAGKQAKYIEAEVQLESGAGPWNNLTATGMKSDSLVVWDAIPDDFVAACEANVHPTAKGTDVISFAADSALSDSITIKLAIFN